MYWESGGIAPDIPKLGPMYVSGQLHAPAALLPDKDPPPPVPIG
jgi:hypothetical protein